MKRILLLLLLPLTLAFAADAPRKPDPFAGLLAAPDDLVKARTTLGLTDEQVAKLRAVYEANISAYRAKTAAVGDAQRALRDALLPQPPDVKAAAARFDALLAAERAVKEAEFGVLLAARTVLTPEQFEKVRALKTASAPTASAASREDAVKQKLERLKQIIGEREKAGKPPSEHEKTIRELERAVKEKNIEKAEPLVDQLLRALGDKSADAPSGPDQATERRVHLALREAMQRKDVAAVERAVTEGIAAAGASLAEPEEPVKPERPPADAVELTQATLPAAFAPMLAEIERVKVWKIGLDPAQFGFFPRGIGSVVIGTLAARRAGCAEPERLLAVAREAGDFLVWAQERGGTGVFPMPARRNGEGKVWGIVERALKNAEQQGRYGDIVHNGWCVDDAGIGDDGGLQIENAVCAIGVLHLYEATQDEKYLRSAKAAGDWAIGRECVPNWNYNSFSVWLLAELHRVTGDARYLAAAKEKTRLGVLPGQLKDGPREGRWLDPHNARPNYHYILTRSLACLLPRLERDDDDREPIARALRRALLAWNPTFPRDGAPNIASASEALALLELRLPDHAKLLGETGVRPALTTLERLGTAALAAGKRASDPSAWGLLLEAAAKRGLPKSAATSRLLGDFPLATNYREGTGFIPGANDRAPEEQPSITDGTQLRFPNSRTDPFTFDRDSPELHAAAQLAAGMLGENTALRFIAPRDGFTAQLAPHPGEVQFIVNQPFHHTGHDLLVTWSLPPGWSPQESNAVLILCPGFLHTNNSKLFAQRSQTFLRAWFETIRQSQSDRVMLMQINMGGRTSSGFQPGFEEVVAEALEWGAQHLGLDRQRLVLAGGSRGGYGSFVLGARLAVRDGLRVQGIFSSVFGTASGDYQHLELVPSDLSTKLKIGFPEWRRRLCGSVDLAEVEKLGPLGAAALLRQAAARAPIHVFGAFGTADPTMLPGSAVKLRAALQNAPGLSMQWNLYYGGGHDSGDSDRNDQAAAFTAALADGREPQRATALTLIAPDGARTTATALPPHLRLPAALGARADATGEVRRCAVDLTGPAGANFRVAFKDANDIERVTLTGALDADGCAQPDFLIPDAPGDYRVEFACNGQPIGAPASIHIHPTLHAEVNWRPDRMPVIWRM